MIEYPYRYGLQRCVHAGNACPTPERQVVWIMLNPSTATDTRDDHTIRKCIGFTKRWGFDSLTVVNLFAMRATYPKDLYAAMRRKEDVVGPRNDEVISALRYGFHGRLFVCAWGASRLMPRVLSRINEVTELLTGLPLHCLGFTKGGNPERNFAQPRHPLMLPYATQLQRYPQQQAVQPAAPEGAPA